MDWREIAPEDLCGLRTPLIIDVRSPAEFDAERLLGSVNIPILNDNERAIVGLIYKEQGDLVARRKALTIIAPKIPEIIDQVVNLRTHSQTVVVHCWRGGLRSEAVSSVLSIAGIASFRLTGGYKAWRNMVLRDLSDDRYKFEPIVLYGLTGAGKTEILQELLRNGAQILDLEAMAMHRGSVFGGLGKNKQPSQKNFEAELWYQLKHLDPDKPVFLEAESRKIGRLSLPDAILSRINTGTSIMVECDLAQRAERLANDYLSSCQSKAIALEESLLMLGKLQDVLGRARVDEIGTLARNGEILESVKILLAEYYDRLYAKALKNKKFAMTITHSDTKTAATLICEWSQSRLLSDLNR